MKLATKIAHRSEFPVYRHGAVLERGGTIVALGVNSAWKSAGKRSTHAEVAALMKAGKNSHGCDLYVARVNQAGEPALSRPCPACASVLKTYGIRNVYHT